MDPLEATTEKVDRQYRSGMSSQGKHRGRNHHTTCIVIIVPASHASVSELIRIHTDSVEVWKSC